MLVGPPALHSSGMCAFVTTRGAAPGAFGSRCLRTRGRGANAAARRAAADRGAAASLPHLRKPAASADASGGCEAQSTATSRETGLAPRAAVGSEAAASEAAEAGGRRSTLIPTRPKTWTEVFFFSFGRGKQKRAKTRKQKKTAPLKTFLLSRKKKEKKNG